jgi:predicted ATPase
VRDLIAEEQLRRPLLERLESLEPDSFEFRPRTRAADDGSVAEGSESYPALADPEAEVSRLQEVIRESAADRVTELVLVDERTGTVVTHRDVGIGVSQVLPVLVSANANWGRVIAIEQPEIHLHPALQAELGDVFIESALGERRNTFLLETHSEHLILRVLRRIRETTDGELPSGLQPLRPTDVQVVYCRPTREGAVLHELPITEDGEFARPWPDGFFAERSRELF